MLSLLFLSLEWINIALSSSYSFLPTSFKDSLRGRRLSSSSGNHVSVEEAGSNSPESESKKANERGELKEKYFLREAGEGEDALEGMEEVQSKESNGRRSDSVEAHQLEDMQAESQEVEKEEQTTGSDGGSDKGSRSSLSLEGELCQKQKSPARGEESSELENQDSEASIGRVCKDSFSSDHNGTDEAGSGSVESVKEEDSELVWKPGEGASETGGVDLDKGSEPPSGAGESDQGGSEVCENRTDQVGPGKTLDRGGATPSVETKVVTNRPPLSAEVGLSTAAVRFPLPRLLPETSKTLHVAPTFQLQNLRGCLFLCLAVAVAFTHHWVA